MDDDDLMARTAAGEEEGFRLLVERAGFAPEEIILGAMEFAQQQNQILIELQEEIIAALPPTKWEFTPPVLPEDLKKLVFDEKRVTKKELKAALAANWQGNGYGEIRKMCCSLPAVARSPATTRGAS